VKDIYKIMSKQMNTMQIQKYMVQ